MVKPVKVARIMRSDDVEDELAMVLLSNYTIKWRIQELSVDILKQTIVAAKRRNLILELADLGNDAQFIVVVQLPATEDNVRQFLFCRPLVKNTTGKKMFKKVDSFIEEHQLSHTHYVFVCASIMMRTKKLL